MRERRCGCPAWSRNTNEVMAWAHATACGVVTMIFASVCFTYTRCNRQAFCICTNFTTAINTLFTLQDRPVASIWFETWGVLGSRPSPLLRKRPETTPSTSKAGGHDPPTPRTDAYGTVRQTVRVSVVRSVRGCVRRTISRTQTRTQHATSVGQSYRVNRVYVTLKKHAAGVHWNTWSGGAGVGRHASSYPLFVFLQTQVFYQQTTLPSGGHICLSTNALLHLPV
jgi:hypothetical protein